MLNATYTALIGLLLVALATCTPGSTQTDQTISQDPNQVPHYIHQNDQDKDPSYRGSGR